jgi:hypothetical protein
VLLLTSSFVAAVADVEHKLLSDLVETRLGAVPRSGSSPAPTRPAFEGGYSEARTDSNYVNAAVAFKGASLAEDSSIVDVLQVGGLVPWHACAPTQCSAARATCAAQACVASAWLFCAPRLPLPRWSSSRRH